MSRWPTRLHLAACFVGGCSFLGFHFVPAWLMAPLFFLMPAVGPLLLILAGALAMRRARRASEKLTASRLVVGTLVACALALVPVAGFDFLFFGTVPYIGPLILLVAIPFHVACVGVFGAGLYALAEAEGVAQARPIAVAATAGFLLGGALTAVRFGIVPRSRGVFLESFSSSGAVVRVPGPLEPYGQQDVAETLGAQPRSYHEPIAAIGNDSLWIAKRSKEAACSGYWIERKGLATAGPGWRECLPASPGQTLNPTAMAYDSGSGLFVVGFDVRDGRESWWVKRYDALGVEDRRWDKSGPSDTKVDRAYGLSLARDGSVYIVGEKGDINLPGTFGWVRKFNADGSEAVDGWNKQFANAGERRPTMAAVAATLDLAGNVYVLLDLYNSHSVRKFDRDGHELWEKPLTAGPKDLAIAANAGGDLFLSGASGYPDQAWIKKVNADGSDAWEKTFPNGHLSSTLAVAFDRSNHIYLAGYGTGRADQNSYWWIKKLGPDGASEQWNTIVSGPDHTNVPFQVHVNAKGELIALGYGTGWEFSRSALERWWGW